ncbi:MAG TPA: DNA recombination protein RmuC [Candidatus Woesebacteria bacterium]|nr:DNA recombination protein RmuC [Candidatus Woesebacteria bacterium]
MTLIYLLLFLILAAVIYFIYLQKQSKTGELDPKVLENLITIADQKLGEKNQIIQTDLVNKKEAIENMVKQVLDQLSIVEKERIGSFNGLKEAIENSSKISKDLSATTEGLKRILSNNQLRGAFGEKVAEDLLKQSGFVIGTDYSKQESVGESRPDFTLYLPDKTKINIDSKFPYSNILKMSETEDPSQKIQYLKLFEQDIKKKISDVSSRNYINPEENTVDFVVVFIPNEMIFSFIYEKFPDILEESFNKKIVFAGPFSFTAILRMVRQAYENFRYQKNVQSIIAQIKLFEKEFIKYNEEFEKIGDKIDSLSKSYDSVNTTRSRQLLRVMDKIKLENEIDSGLN